MTIDDQESPYVYFDQIKSKKEMSLNFSCKNVWTIFGYFYWYLSE